VSIDRSTSTTVGQTFFSQTKDGNLLPLDFLLGQRQNSAVILQQHNAFGSCFTDQRLVLGLVDRLFFGNLGVIETLLTFQEL
jgi:hypothetical protein